MQEIGISKKWEKPKIKKKQETQKVGNQKKKEIRKSRKSENVGNLKMKEIGESRKSEKVGDQKKLGNREKQEIR